MDSSYIRISGTIGDVGDAAQGTCFTDRYIGICLGICQIGFDFVAISCRSRAKVSGCIRIRTDSNIAIICTGTVANSD